MYGLSRGRGRAAPWRAPPGFAEVASEGDVLTFPDYPGNNMFQTLGDLTVEPAVGLLFVDWDTGTGSTLRCRPRRPAAAPKALRTPRRSQPRTVSFAAIAEIVGHVALNVLTNYFNNAAQVEIDFPVVLPGRDAVAA